MKNKMEDQKQFKTNDFYQAVVLKTLGLQLDNLEERSVRFVTFVFNDPESLAEGLLNRYWNNEAVVNAKALIENINELKTRLYSRIHK